VVKQSRPVFFPSEHVTLPQIHHLYVHNETLCTVHLFGSGGIPKFFLMIQIIQCMISDFKTRSHFPSHYGMNFCIPPD
jgi:hypothetical protein